MVCFIDDQNSCEFFGRISHHFSRLDHITRSKDRTIQERKSAHCSFVKRNYGSQSCILRSFRNYFIHTLIMPQVQWNFEHIALISKKWKIRKTEIDIKPQTHESFLFTLECIDVEMSFGFSHFKCFFIFEIPVNLAGIFHPPCSCFFTKLGKKSLIALTIPNTNVLLRKKTFISPAFEIIS